MKLMKRLKRWVARAGGVLRRRPDHDVLAREMAAHIEIATDEYIRRGMTPEAARRAAKVDAGSLDAATEAYRDQYSIPIVEAALRDLRFAVLALGCNPRFGAGIVASLALGIGLNTAIFTVADNVLRRPLPYRNPDQLVAVGSLIGGEVNAKIDWTSYPNTITAWRRSRSLAGVATTSSSHHVIAGDAGPEYATGASASPNLLTVLGTRPALGRWFTEDELETPVVVLSDAVWRRQFASDSSVIGRTLRVDARLYTIVGVMPRGVGLPLGAAYWLPMVDPWGQVIGRLRDGVSRETVDAELTTLSPMSAVYKQRGQTLDIIVAPLHDQLYGSAKPALLLLLGAAAMLLLITCANVTNLSLARALERRREFAMRAALGAGRGAIGSLLVFENLLLTLVGGAVGLFLAYVVTGSLVAMAPSSVTLASDVTVRGAQVAFAAVLAVIACLVISVAPVMGALPERLVAAFGQSSVQAGRGRVLRRIRTALVSVQLALTLLLMTGAVLLLRSVERMTRPDHLGFVSQGIVVVNVQPFGDRYRQRGARATFARDLALRLRALPGVQRVASGPPPLVAGAGDEGYREGFNQLFSWSDPASRQARVGGAKAGVGGTMVWVKHVDPPYRETFGITLAGGRWFTQSDDSTAARVALVNRAAARLFFGELNPVGRIIEGTALSRAAPPPMVIGVVDDVLQRDLTLAANAEVFLPIAQQPASPMAMLSVKSSAPAVVTIAAIQRELRAMDPALAAARLESMDSIVKTSMERHTFVLRLLALFASLGLVLAVIGLYAIVSYLVAQRTIEIGVRIALGAQRRDVLVMVLRESATLAAIGIAVGIPLSIAGSRLLSGFLYEVKPYDLASLAIGPAVLAAVALAAAWMPARRAAAVDPALTLRRE